MISQGQDDIGNANLAIENYRLAMNQELKIFSIDLRGYGKEMALDFGDTNYVRIFGMNDSVLRFISLKEVSQVREVKDYAEAHIVP